MCDWNDFSIAKVRRCGIIFAQTLQISTSQMSSLHGCNATKQGSVRPSNLEAQALLNEMLLSQEISLHQLQQNEPLMTIIYIYIII